MGKDENASSKDFLLSPFPQCFQKASFLVLFKIGIVCYPFPKRQILSHTKLKEFADDIFEFNEDGKSSSIR